ncbi:MAG: hypothetical protein JXR91_12295 [Deltaproteobacteria bacterium]|nr:hypothetical protein [Deltaproteobacteria bacterium]
MIFKIIKKVSFISAIVSFLGLVTACSNDNTSSVNNGTGTDVTNGTDNNTGSGLNSCDYLIECYRSTGIAGVTAIVQAYGPDGTCWTTAGLLASDCLTECHAALEGLRLAYPDAESCIECTGNADCAGFDFNTCWDGTCVKMNCGNGIIEGGEICDPGNDPSCLADCTHLTSECYPLSDVNQCGAGMKCVVNWQITDELLTDSQHYFRCEPITGLEESEGGWCEKGTGCGDASVCMNDFSYSDFYYNCYDVCDLNDPLETCDCTAFPTSGPSTIAASGIGYCD